MNARKTMPKFDIAKLNAAVDKLLETTDNPRHRFLLQAFGRHRHLEVAGRYEEICAPDMMIADPVYHFHYTGLEFELRGRESGEEPLSHVGGNEPDLLPHTRGGGSGRPFRGIRRHCVPASVREKDRGRRSSCPIFQALFPASWWKRTSARDSTTLTVAICSFTRRRES